jgi:imidazolonepropionase-like amidohydrolase
VNRAGLAALALTLVAGCSEAPARSFVKASVPTFALTHVRVIDGTGAPARDDQTVLVRDGRIAAVGSAATVAVPRGVAIVAGRGRTVIPGLVGMHEHLFYELNEVPYESAAAFARLYLAAGVTTIRTAGAVDLYEDLRVKKAIDDGRLPGPKIHVASPYFGATDPSRIANMVATLADRGVTSFKAYTTMRSEELRALIDAAHARGLRVTGHLCAVGFRDAAAMGIDNLEHGLGVDTEFYSGKQLDVCPEQGKVLTEQMGMDPPREPAIQQLVAYLVRHDVAVTSTLAVFESLTGDADVYDARMPRVLTWRVRGTYDRLLPAHSDRTTPAAQGFAVTLWHEMQFERMFVDAGGRLMAGADPTGWGGIVAGFADQRELELLVAAGFKPEMAIHIATQNGAEFLRESDRVGSVQAGRQADLVLVRGNPAARISDVRKVETVFKDGVGYAPDALIAASAGTVGEFDARIFLRFPFNVILLALLAMGCLDLVQRWRRRRAAATRFAGAGTPEHPAAIRARTPLRD